MRDLQDIRIASLVPSLTELLIELGLGPKLVARTGFCIHPAPLLSQVPKVGGTKDVNLDKLRRLAPTHVLVNIDENRQELLPVLQAMGAEVLVTHPLAPDDNLDLVDQLVEAFGGLPGVAERGDRLKAALREELAHSRAFPSPVQQVLYLIWHDPWMTVARDTYISRMLATVNLHTLPAADGGPHGAARYPTLHGAEHWLVDVQQVLLSSEPFRFDDAHLAEAQRLCPRAAVRRVDGELLSWYGARAVSGLRYLRELASA